jgi:hypothetical protein
MTEDQSYKIRYLIEPWGKPRDVPTREVTPGVRVAIGSNYGYTDLLFVVSVIMTDEGEVGSVLLMDSENGLNPSRKVLEMVRDQINHHLEHHVGG